MAEELQQIAQNTYTIPTLVGFASVFAGGLIGIAAGYFLGRKSIPHDVLSDKTVYAQTDLKRAEVNQQEALQKLAYAENEAEHKRSLVTLAEERKNKLEDEDRKRNWSLEDEVGANQKQEKDNAREDMIDTQDKAHQLQVLQQLSGTVPAIQAYFDNVWQAYESQKKVVEGQRAEFRQQLVADYLKVQEETDLNKFSLDDGVACEDDITQINNLLDLKFPLPEAPKLPEELSAFFNSLTQTVEDANVNDEDEEDAD